MVVGVPPPEFERIIEILNAHGVNYVVIGGVAAILQGVALPRTADLDVTPSRDLANKRRLASALVELDAQLRVPDLDEGVTIPLDEQTFNNMITMTFMTKYGPFDVCFVPDGTEGFEDLQRDASVIERLGVTIPVASLADIVRSKRAAGREKDARHLVVLLEHVNRDDSAG